ncbi:MAG: hypothetical protein R3B70_47750 [Polyangiaceae bacterium]
MIDIFRGTTITLEAELVEGIPKDNRATLAVRRRNTDLPPQIRQVTKSGERCLSITSPRTSPQARRATPQMQGHGRGQGLRARIPRMALARDAHREGPQDPAGPAPTSPSA